jgi:hypothetical protein
MGTIRGAELRPHQYECRTVGGGCMSRVNGLARLVRIRLDSAIPFLGSLEKGTPVTCGRSAVRSSRELLALDVQGG